MQEVFRGGGGRRGGGEKKKTELIDSGDDKRQGDLTLKKTKQVKEKNKQILTPGNKPKIYD